MSTLYEFESALNLAERRLQRTIGEAKALADQIALNRKLAEEAHLTVVACEQAVGFLNSFADEQQIQVQQKIEGLVTHGLQTIFEEDWSFHLVAEQKASRSEISFMLRSSMGDKVVETPLLDARGGGVAAVSGFLLRLIVTLLRGERPLLCLDEMFAQLSSAYEPRLASFLSDLVKQTGVQILLITHSDAYAEHADVVYRFSQKDGRTLCSRTDT